MPHTNRQRDPRLIAEPVTLPPSRVLTVSTPDTSTRDSGSGTRSAPDPRLLRLVNRLRQTPEQRAEVEALVADPLQPVYDKLSPWRQAKPEVPTQSPSPRPPRGLMGETLAATGRESTNMAAGLFGATAAGYRALKPVAGVLGPAFGDVGGLSVRGLEAMAQGAESLANRGVSGDKRGPDRSVLPDDASAFKRVAYKAANIVGGGVPYVGGGVLAAAATGGAGVIPALVGGAAMGLPDAGRRYAETKGKAEGQRALEATLTGVVSTVFNAVPINRIFGPGVARLVGESIARTAAKLVAREGGEAALSGVINAGQQFAQRFIDLHAGGDKEALDNITPEMVESFFGGALLTATARAVTGHAIPKAAAREPVSAVAPSPELSAAGASAASAVRDQLAPNGGNVATPALSQNDRLAESATPDTSTSVPGPENAANRPALSTVDTPRGAEVRPVDTPKVATVATRDTSTRIPGPENADTQAWVRTVRTGQDPNLSIPVKTAQIDRKPAAAGAAFGDRLNIPENAAGKYFGEYDPADAQAEGFSQDKRFGDMGPLSREDAVALARIAAKGGARDVAVTPVGPGRYAVVSRSGAEVPQQRVAQNATPEVPQQDARALTTNARGDNRYHSDTSKPSGVVKNAATQAGVRTVRTGQNPNDQGAAGTTKARKHEYSSTQLSLSTEASTAIKRAAMRIPDSDLAPDGRESNPHVTVKYGLHTDDASEVARLLADEPPFEVRLGKTSLFENPEHDVVKADVDSPELHALNAKIAAAVKNTDTHPEYKPHATLAYVKPGRGKKYAGSKAVEGQTTTVDRITFSDRDGNETTIRLGGKKPVDPDTFTMSKGEPGEPPAARLARRAAEFDSLADSVVRRPRPSLADRAAKALSGVAERSEKRATEIVRGYEATVAEARRRGGPGSRVGATIDPEFYWHKGIAIAARAASEGITTGKRLVQFVRDAAASLPKGSGDQTKPLLRVVRAVLDRAKGPSGAFDPERFDAAAQEVLDVARERSAARGRAVGASAKSAAGVTKPQPTVTESQALRGSMKAQERAGRAGFAAGRAEGREIGRLEGQGAEARRAERDSTKTVRNPSKIGVPGMDPVRRDKRVYTESEALRGALRKSARDSAAAYRAGVKDRAAKARADIAQLKLDAKDKNASADQIRDRLVDIADAALPPSVRGAMLRSVARAKTPANLARAAERIESLSASFEASRDAKALAKKMTPQRMRVTMKLTEGERADVQSRIDDATRLRGEVMAELQKGRPNWVAMREKANRIAELVNEAKEIVHQRKTAEKVRIGRRIQSVESVRRPIALKLAKMQLRKPTADGKPAGDVGRATKFMRGLFNNKTFAAKIDREPNGPTQRLLVRTLRRAENARLAVIQRAWSLGDKAAKSAGYSGIGDLMAKASGTLGEASQKGTGLKFGGRELTLGEAMYFVAQDPDTKALDYQGQRYTFADNPNGESFSLDSVDRAEIEKAIGPENVALVRALKDIRKEVVYEDLKRSHRELKGYDFDEVADQWPRSRNQAGSEASKYESGSRGMVRRHLEDSGRLKVRENGKDPLVVKDLPTQWLATINAEARIAHEAVPIRTVEAVLLSPEMRRAIESRMGEDGVKFIEDAVNAAGSPGPASQPSLIDRALDTIRGHTSRAMVALNIGSAAKNVFGAAKLLAVPEFNAADLKYGLSRMASDGTMDTLAKYSPWLWQRYAQGPQLLFGVNPGDISAFSSAGATESLKALGRSAKGLKVLDIVNRNLPAVIDQVRLLPMADSAPARIAFHAAMHLSRRTNPKRTAAQHAKFAARMAERAMRDTQNTTGPNDSPWWINNMAMNNSGYRLLAQFRGDSSANFNLLAQAIYEGNSSPRAIAGLALSTLGSAAVSMLIGQNGLKYTTGLVTGNMDPDEREESEIKMIRAGLREVVQATSSLIPGADYAAAALFNRIATGTTFGDEFSTPVTSALSGVIGDGIGVIDSARKRFGEPLNPEEREKATARLLRTLAKFAESGSTVVGIPYMSTVGKFTGGSSREPRTAVRTGPRIIAGLDNADIDRASRHAAEYLAGFPPERRPEAARSLIDSLKRKAPLGSMTKADRDEALRSDPAFRDEVRRNNEWLNMLNRAIRDGYQTASKNDRSTTTAAAR